MNLFGQNIKAMKACTWFLFPSLLILRLCVASQSCMSHRLWVIYPGTCLRVRDVSWGLLEDVWFRIVPYLQGFRLGRGAVSYQVCFNTVMEQSERQLSSYWQMVVCVCVCVFLPAFGWGFQFVGGREVEFGEEEEVESFRERSAEAQLVRPPV